MRLGFPLLAAALMASGCGRSSPVVAADGRLEIEIVGTGEVSSVAASGIDCGTDCATTIDIGTEVELLATPGATRAFGSWDGPCAGADETCTFTFTGDTTLTARFGFALTVVTSGDGIGLVATSGDDTGISCGSDCTEVYDEGATVTLFPAVTSKEGAFGRWFGTCSSGTPCVVEMDGPQTVTARFDLRGRALTAWTWGGGNDDVAWDVAIDTATGDVLVCGGFDGVLDFDGGGAVDSRGRDGVLLRRTAAGVPVWKRFLRDPDNDGLDEIRNCLFDGSGGITVSGVRDSNNGSGGDVDTTGDSTPEVSAVATNGDGVDGFVARFALDGTFDWINSTTGNQQTNVDADAMTALAAGGNDIWGGGDMPTTTNGYIQRYVANNMAATQGPQNDTQIGGTNSQGMDVRAIARNGNGDIFFTGMFDNQITWGAEVLAAGNMSEDIFVASGTNAAAPRWLVGFGGNQNDRAEAIAFDAPTGRLAVTGVLANDVFLAVLNADDGSLQYFHRFEGPGNDAARAVAWLGDGGLVLAGEISNAADFGLGAITTKGLDAFIARFDATYEPVWAHRYGGDQADRIHSIATGPDGSIWASGEFRDVLVTGGDAGTLSAIGNADALILRVLP